MTGPVGDDRIKFYCNVKLNYLLQRLTSFGAFPVDKFAKAPQRKEIMKKTITTEEAKKKTIKPEWQPGGSRRQELLDKAVEYLKAPIMETQADRHHFCINNLMMTETEYLEALNKATNGGVVASVWN